MAGDSLWHRARCSRVVSRGVIDFDRIDRCLHAVDGCGKSARTRYHLWLFRSRQSKLEFSFSFGDQSGDSRRLACTLVSEFEQILAQARRLPVCVPQPKRVPAIQRAEPTSFANTRYSMIRKLKSGKYRLYSRKKNPKTQKRRNLGTFSTEAQAKKHERAIQYFKRH